MKKITVVGLGRSGCAAALLAVKTGAQVRITELGSGEALEKRANELRQEGISVELGGHTAGFIVDADLVVTSPGVSEESPALKLAREKGIKVVDEIEFAFGFCKAPVVAVTGTNGKSTTTSLIGHIFKTAGKKTAVLGNIGSPFSGQVMELGEEAVVVLEVSSFQLSRIDKFKPRVAVFLNITQNHFDRHKDFDEYLKAKMNIFLNQDVGDCAVLNEDDPILKDAAKDIKSKILYFNRHEDCNKENAAAASLAAGALGITNEDIEKALASFKPLEHRREFVREAGGVRFTNDSKSTTPEATLRALQASRGDIILIAGGRDKGLDYTCVKDIIVEKTKAVVLIGESAKKIASALNGSGKIIKATSLEEAVETACKLAAPGDEVLLSPMCASFDMFEDFEHRGREFKRIINEKRYQVPFF